MSATFEIRFEDPPPKTVTYVRAEPLDYQRMAALLCAKPGKWAVVGLADTSHRAAAIAHRISAGQVQALAIRGVFKAQSRTVNGQYRVYAKFLGQVEQVAS